MHKTWLVPLAIMALVACTDGGGGSLFGDEIGALTDDEQFELDPESPAPTSPDGVLVVGDEVASGFQGNFVGTCLPDDAPVADPPMVATGGAGFIEVLHQGVVTGIEPMWYIHGVLDEDTRTISMVYEETNENPSTETCLWSMLYVIHGVPTGEWTVEARGDSSTTTVY